MRSVIWAICVLTIAGLVASYIFIQYSETYENCVAEHRAKEVKPNSKELSGYVLVCEATFLSRRSEVVTAVATVYIGLFTLILGIATALLWEETRDAAKISKATLVLTQRPRLVVRLFDFNDSESGSNHNTGIIFELANVGGTEAFITDTSSVRTDAKSQLTRVPKYIDDPIPLDSKVFKPGHRESVEIIDKGAFHLFPTKTFLQGMSFKFVVYGFIDYKDGIGNTRRTAFAWEWNTDTRQFEKVNNGNYTYED